MAWWNPRVTEYKVVQYCDREITWCSRDLTTKYSMSYASFDITNTAMETSAPLLPDLEHITVQIKDTSNSGVPKQPHKPPRFYYNPQAY